MAAGVQGLAGIDGVQNDLVTYDHLERKEQQLFTDGSGLQAEGWAVLGVARGAALKANLWQGVGWGHAQRLRLNFGTGLAIIIQ